MRKHATSVISRGMSRWPLLLLPVYPALAIAGALTHWQGFSLAAIALLLSVLLWPALRTRRALPWLVWLALLGGMLWLAAHALAALALDLVPVLISALLAWLFGRTLRARRQPLVAQAIAVVEGDDRLALPGVACYARQLTAFWSALLALQAMVLALLLACAVPGGLLLAVGIAPPLALPAGWALGYVHLGGYLLLGGTFVLEYAFRRWHLRHIAHRSLRGLLVDLAQRWPQLVRGGKMP